MKNLLLKFTRPSLFTSLSLFCLSSEAADFSILKSIVNGLSRQYTRQLSTARVIPAPVLTAPKKFIDVVPPFDDWLIEQRKSLSDFLHNNPQYLKNLPKEIKIVEVGPRDGLQNEKVILSPTKRVELIQNLQNAGLKTIEAGSFVSSELKQMDKSDEVYAQLMRQQIYSPSTTSYPMLVPNKKGMDRAIGAQVEDISVFTAPSEGFTRKNINRTVDDSLEDIKGVIKRAQFNQMRVRGYVSCILGCPYEGKVPIEKVGDVTEQLLKMGCYEVSLGDTIGVGTPPQTDELLDYLINERKIPANKLAAHFHDTNGLALHNIVVALHYGISVVDSSIHGLGGCPHASKPEKPATGNVATEKVVFLCDYLGIKTGVNLARLIKIKPWIAQELGRQISKL